MRPSRSLMILLVVVPLTLGYNKLANQLLRLQRKLPRGDNGMSFWTQHCCRDINRLMKKKELTIQKIDKTIEMFSKMNNKKHEIEIFKIFASELDEGEEMVTHSLKWIDSVISGNYRDLLNLKESSKQRLESLRNATLQEEKEFNNINSAQDQLQLNNVTHLHGVIEDILTAVSSAADDLEKQFDLHQFDKALNTGGSIETIVRKKKNTLDSADLLVDSMSNEFALARSSDHTQPTEDHRLVKDILYIGITSFFMCMICTMVHLPSMFGYIIGGVLLGPSGFDVLKCLVQIETLGNFGIFFILFSIGLEFSPNRIIKVARISVMSAISISFLMVVVGLIIVHILPVNPLVTATDAEVVFILTCLSLSSTPLVVKFLASSQPNRLPVNRQQEGDIDYSSILMGILVMQDIILGVLIAVLPNMASHKSTTSNQPTNMKSENDRILMKYYIITASKLIVSLLIVLVVCYLVSRFLIGRFMRQISKINNGEMNVLSAIIVMFSMILLTGYLEVSMELGCFVAGAIISSQGHQMSSKVEQQLQSLQHFLSCIFFVSIGLHVFPKFLLQQIPIMASFTFMIVLFKYSVTLIVMKMVLPKTIDRQTKWIVCAGLSQVSEFSFVLCSRAFKLHLISREVYLLILGITTLSLILAPLLWRISLHYLHVHPAAERRLSITHEDSMMNEMNLSHKE